MPNNVAGIYPSRLPARPTAPTKPQCCCPACVGLECLDRTRYFAGQLLTEADLNNDQSYWLAKSRLHNRYLHGWGVVCGLQVVCGECDGWVTVKTGYAIDPCGNDIIVCTEQPFNVIKAIQACCTPTKTPDCSPLRYTPSPECQDAEQTWCIAIEYQEQSSRLVTPLQPPPVKANGCDCGCGNPTVRPPAPANSCGCTPAAAPATPSASTGACEPTRIIEGFKLCLVAPPEPPAKGQPQPGTIGYAMANCLAPLQNLLSNSPAVNGPPAQAYQAVCKYLAAVRNALTNSYLTHCQIETALSQIHVPPPDNSNNYSAELSAVVTALQGLLAAAVFDCVCYSIVPQCPADPCDNRVILACVTVQDGKIIDICHFGARRQVVTFPTLYYWLSFLGLDQLLTAITSVLGQVCCATEQDRRALFGAATFERQPVNSGGFTNPAMINRIATYALSQRLGAPLINVVSPAARTLDLRPFVGKNLEEVQSTLGRQYQVRNITVKDVSADPAWDQAALTAGAQYTPAAFSLEQPLTVFTTGEQRQIVGFEVTDPTEAKIQALQEQINQLHGQLGSLRARPGSAGPPAGSPPAKGKPKRGK